MLKSFSLKKAILFFTFCLLAIIIWFGEERSFYCLANNKCITVWKTYGNTCYIIPGKYFGLLMPSGNHLVTTNTSRLDIIWKGQTNNIIVAIDSTSKIINKSREDIRFINYNLQKQLYDSLFIYFDGRYSRYKSDVDFITIDIQENYASGRNGVLGE